MKYADEHPRPAGRCSINRGFWSASYLDVSRGELVVGAGEGRCAFLPPSTTITIKTTFAAVLGENRRRVAGSVAFCVGSSRRQSPKEHDWHRGRDTENKGVREQLQN